MQQYGGYIDDDPNQFVRLFVTENVIKGLIIDKRRGAFYIEPLTTFIKSIKDDRSVVYKLSDTKTEQAFCGNELVKSAAIDAARQTQTNETAAVPTSCRILEVATEADGEYYSNHGSNVATTFNDILAVMNVVDGVYNNTFNIRVSVVFQSLYQTSVDDPYTATNSDNAIAEFQNYWNNNRAYVLRDEATFFTGKNMTVVINGTTFQVLGQVPQYAGICRNLNTSYLFVTDGQFNFYTVTHETGHLFNAGHPDPNGSDCQPNRSVMCQGANIANVFFAAASQNEINSHLNAGDGCLRSYSSIGMDGPTALCSSANYEALGGPVGSEQNWSWSTSSNISLNTTSGKIVTATANGGTSGWIEATQSIGCPITYRLNVAIGPPNVSNVLVDNILNPGPVAVNSGSTHYVQSTSSNDPNATYSLNASTNSGNIVLNLTGVNAGNCQINVSGSIGNASLAITASNSCGTYTRYVTFYIPSGYRVAPNPAKDNMTVIFDDASYQDALPDQLELLSEKEGKALQTIDIKDMYAKKSFKNGNQVVFDIHNYPRGIYYLRITNPRQTDDKKVDVIRLAFE